MNKNVKEIVKQMTLEEKASLCSGLTSWETKPVKRLGIPSIFMSDGPHGLRKETNDLESGHSGKLKTVPATCFPTASALASSWDVELIERIGEALGEECQANGVDIILGPGINIKRSPLCGRNFEYYSEDPYLAGKMGTSFVNGVQSKGVGTSLKHFAANNQEYERMSISAEIDERTLREIYLNGFEMVVKEGKPWTVMCSYNRINGTYSSENKYTLTDILRGEWGFEGFVVSDWGAVDNRVNALKAGLNLEMPATNGYTDKMIVEAVREGKLDESILDRSVENILNIVFKAVDNRRVNYSYSVEGHHRLAREAARECMVLLKNNDNILPIDKSKVKSIAIIGEFAKKPRYEGGGSSHVNPTRIENSYDEIIKLAKDIKINYAGGYSLENDEIDWNLIDEAKKAASASDVAIIFAGLPDSYESEGYDREHMNMPSSHVKLIEEVSSVQGNSIVVLCNGSPVLMDSWINNVKAVLEAYLTGQGGAGAAADLLFGEAVPCGKLAETFPHKLSHNPSYLNFPGGSGKVSYKEGIFVGYRYYDKKEIEPLFPFGYGLSYTSFEYSHLEIDKRKMTDTDTLHVKLKIKNTGKYRGKEIVELYVHNINPDIPRPVKELKGFAKVLLDPGEEKEVCFNLTGRDFAYYDGASNSWTVEAGDYEVMAGRSSKDIPLKEKVHIDAAANKEVKFDRYTLINRWMEDPKGRSLIAGLMEYMVSEPGISIDNYEEEKQKMLSWIGYLPVCKLINFGRGKITEDMLQKVIDAVNAQKKVISR